MGKSRLAPTVEYPDMIGISESNQKFNYLLIGLLTLSILSFWDRGEIRSFVLTLISISLFIICLRKPISNLQLTMIIICWLLVGISALFKFFLPLSLNSFSSTSLPSWISFIFWLYLIGFVAYLFFPLVISIHKFSASRSRYGRRQKILVSIFLLLSPIISLVYLIILDQLSRTYSEYVFRNTLTKIVKGEIFENRLNEILEIPRISEEQIDDAYCLGNKLRGLDYDIYFDRELFTTDAYISDSLGNRYSANFLHSSGDIMSISCKAYSENIFDE